MNKSMQLITEYLNKGYNDNQIAEELIKALKGAFAIAILFANKDKIIAIKRGSPLAVGYGEDKNFIGSDAIGLAPFTKKINCMRTIITRCLHTFYLILKDQKRFFMELYCNFLNIFKSGL